VELVIGLTVIGLIIWGLSKLADVFEERNFFFWLIFYLAAGGLGIVVLAMARTGGRA
jgi:hypothetical protein